MRVPDATSLPPRSTLPRDIEIPVVPGLGRSWYDRGGKYWARRAAISFMWAVVALLIVLIDVGIFHAVRQSSTAGFVVLLVIDAAVAVVVLAYIAVRTARRWNTPAPPGQAGAVLRPRRRPGAVVSGLAQIGYLLAVLAAAVVFLFCPALVLALFVMSLLPETLPERQARLWVAGQFRERGHGTTAR
jgi:Ni/Fe-hydrogenase subunit HybB-like protein